MRWRDALGDRGLADAGVADQHRVVLGPARQHLHRASDLLVAADDRVELAVARQLGEVAGVLRQRLVLPLGLRIGDALVAAHLGERLEQRVLVHARFLQRAAGGAEVLGDQRQQQVLAGDVLVLELLRLAAGLLDQVLQPPAQRKSRRRSRAPGACSSSARATVCAHRPGSTPSLRRSAPVMPSFWSSSASKHVLGRQLLVRAGLRQSWAACSAS